MLSIEFLSLAILSTLGVGFSLALTLHHWEFRRFIRSRVVSNERTANRATPRVCLFCAVKGPGLQLRENLESLFQLDYPDYELAFAVEAADDPAVPVIRRLIAAHSVPARVVVAGKSAASGQKVANLLAATRLLSTEIEVLAFVDADARPRPNWLKHLIARVDQEGTGATSGYRWMLPQRMTLANLLLCGINAGVTSLLGRHQFNLIWGGSWAIHRNKFRNLEIREAWEGTLSDDLVATRVIRQSNLHVEFEPGCLCPSPVDTTWPELFEFLRRQFLIGRRYQPLHWYSGLAAGLLLQSAFWFNAVAALLYLGTGAILPAALATAVVGVLYGLSILRGHWQSQTAAICVSQSASQPGPSHWFEWFGGPAVGLVCLLAMVSSAFGECITWRGIRYRIRKGGQIELLDRPTAPAALPATAIATSKTADRRAA